MELCAVSGYSISCSALSVTSGAAASPFPPSSLCLTHAAPLHPDGVLPAGVRHLREPHPHAEGQEAVGTPQGGGARGSGGLALATDRGSSETHKHACDSCRRRRTSCRLCCRERCKTCPAYLMIRQTLIDRACCIGSTPRVHVLRVHMRMPAPADGQRRVRAMAGASRSVYYGDHGQR